MINQAAKQYTINNSQIRQSSKYLEQNQILHPLPTIPPKTNNENFPVSRKLSAESQYYQINKPQQANNKMKSKMSLASRYTSNNSIKQKQQILKKIRYINPLARLQYQDKLQEVYTKYTKLSKQTVMKKIKAKNQIAQFQEEQEDQNLGYDQLLQYNFGKENNDNNLNNNFYFQKQQQNQIQFCQLCDAIHSESISNHQIICTQKRSEEPMFYSPYSEIYHKESLLRIKETISRIKQIQYEQLCKCIVGLDRQASMNRSSIFVKNKDEIKNKIHQLKNLYGKDELFLKIVNKVISLMQKV